MALVPRLTVWVSNQILTANALNAEFDNILNNLIPDSIEDASANVAAMQSAVDPGGVGSESLATNLTGELQRLRFVIKRILGTAQWYVAPAKDLPTLATDTATVASDLATLTATVAALSAANPTGGMIPFAGLTPPTGWLQCDGSLVSRTTYASLFGVLGVAWGSGDGSTTFALPDMRGFVPRGRTTGPQGLLGSGTVASNNATFTAHNVIRTGMRIHADSGTLTGITVGTQYFAIVVNANTIAFATTRANALAGTKIVISGTNSLVISQYEDTDASAREAYTTGANSSGLGSFQEDAFADHQHILTNKAVANGADTAANITTSTNNGNTGGSPVAKNETRMKNVYVNYIIKT